MPKVDTTGDCWLWTAALFRKGYGAFRVDSKQLRAHRWSYEHFIGPIPEGMVIRHTCDTPRCVKPEHLVMGTQKQNQEDMLRRGRLGKRSEMSRINRRKSAVLNPVLAAEIREKYALGGHSHATLAREYGVSRGAIQALLERRSWAD